MSWSCFEERVGLDTCPSPFLWLSVSESALQICLSGLRLNSQLSAKLNSAIWYRKYENTINRTSSSSCYWDTLQTTIIFEMWTLENLNISERILMKSHVFLFKGQFFLGSFPKKITIHSSILHKWNFLFIRKNIQSRTGKCLSSFSSSFWCHQNTSQSHSPVNIGKNKVNVIQKIRDLRVTISLPDFTCPKIDFYVVTLCCISTLKLDVCC